jgi:iron complex transport system substrate-binding protein
MSEYRIVSLIASATEIVCALGFEDQLVGRSHECDFPESVKLLPQLTAPKFDVQATSREIDRAVRSIVQDALSVYRVDAQRLEQLRPTHIITQSQCEVCAVSLKDVEQAVCELTSSNPVIVSLEPNALKDVWRDIHRVGRALDAQDRADSLVSRLQSRMMEIVESARAVESKPSVACIEWVDPLMAAGNWMPELVEMAGGLNLFGEPGKHSPWMTWEEIVAKDPDVIIALPCGYGIPRTIEDMPLLSNRQEWGDLKAVRGRNVFVADGYQYFNRPGPRLAESLEILAEIFHPRLFDYGHEGKGWTRYRAT